ncbi:nucleoid-associated protein [Pseudoalteromonas shioyasakiensis]|uniref:nucleoid-associated protein n=1 Tax=Pseudoalteromonas shioyasakiensis TaxID=1190813 RepID=UPI001EFC94FC|nr:nucleoid-associated protein [Pseudoalteromonas shioyasakiensis]MCG9736501.1 nucleoid-associated protein [Pseudoalteromonas shioyasakiensis]
MSSPRALAISQAMRDSIKIHKFIYHILLTDEEEVDYLTAVTLTEDQESFFQEMIAESSRGTKYKFIDAENAPLNTHCNNLIDSLDDNNLFIEQSKLIAHDFKAKHDKRMADGIVVVTTFSMLVNMQPRNFVAILKLDYKPVLQQIRDEEDPSQVKFQEITDSLLEEKAAIQKRALIDVGDSFDWDVIAVERGKSNADHDTDSAIGSHYKNFLSVSLLENNSAVTRKAISHSNKWAQQHEELIPSDVKARVIRYIGAHGEQNINMDDIRDLICEHPDDTTKDRLKASFDTYMDNVELSGVQFTAKPDSIPNSDKRTKVKTNRNVVLEWQGEMRDAGVTRVDRDGQTIYTITADNVNDIS